MQTIEIKTFCSCYMLILYQMIFWGEIEVVTNFGFSDTTTPRIYKCLSDGRWIHFLKLIIAVLFGEMCRVGLVLEQEVKDLWHI